MIGKSFGITVTANLLCSGVQARACLLNTSYTRPLPGPFTSSARAGPEEAVPFLSSPRLGGEAGEQEGWMCLYPTSFSGGLSGFSTMEWLPGLERILLTSLLTSERTSR